MILLFLIFHIALGLPLLLASFALVIVLMFMVLANVFLPWGWARVSNSPPHLTAVEEELCDDVFRTASKHLHHAFFVWWPPIIPQLVDKEFV
jgi:hypothetical protein